MELSPFDLNLRHLRAMTMIVARGSMSAAAEAVGLSQPALTQGLAKLERQFGEPLFERHVDGMAPTPAGAAITQRVEAAFDYLGATLRPRGRGFARPEQLMTATQLHGFLALAGATGFAGAAAATGVSQPALHRAVRDLEQLCGVALVERRGRGVGLTAAGHKLARGARLAEREIAAAIAETSAQHETGNGRIVIGAMPLSRARLLPRAIARLSTQAPRVRIEVVEGSWRELVDPLRDGILDIMIGALRDEAPADLLQEALITDPLAVVGRADHPLIGTEPSVAALTRYPWIVGQGGAPLRQQWERLFASGPLPDAPIECGSVMVIREVLRDTDFLALLSLDQIALEIANGILAPVASLPGTHRVIGITRRAGWRPAPAQQLFLDLVHAVAIESRLPEN